MKALENLTIESTENAVLEQIIQQNIDQKTKPPGALGQMERIAKQVGLILQTTQPELKKPVMFTVAADHKITEEKVSPVPSEITYQQVLSFLCGGGAIGLFCRLTGFDLKVVDAGVDFNFEPHAALINAKVRKGTRNFLKEHAMTKEECNTALSNGRKIVKMAYENGTNVVAFGEMGIGNTTPASALLSVYTGLPVGECVGPGAGLDVAGVAHKADVIQAAIDKHGISADAAENLARFGGLEIATIAGGMLEAAANRMVIIVDGFITTSAFLAAYAISPMVKAYALFGHCSEEQGHIKMLNFLKAEPILNLGMRLGEGSGAAMAYPIIKNSVAMMNEMTSFTEAKVFNVIDHQKATKSALSEK